MERKDFEWKPEYSVHVQVIDNQHKHFISILNKLLHELTKGEPKEVVGNTLDSIVDYAKLHFSTEERYFDEFNYKGAEEHKGEHKKLMEKIDVLKAKRDTTDDPVGLVFETLDFLEDWLIYHLINMDQKYVSCFQEHGLS